MKSFKEPGAGRRMGILAEGIGETFDSAVDHGPPRRSRPLTTDRTSGPLGDRRPPADDHLQWPRPHRRLAHRRRLTGPKAGDGVRLRHRPQGTGHPPKKPQRHRHGYLAGRGRRSIKMWANNAVPRSWTSRTTASHPTTTRSASSSSVLTAGGLSLSGCPRSIAPGCSMTP